MVVPSRHIEFLKQPLSFWLATAGTDNIPEPIKCTGVRFDPQTDIFTCFAPLKFATNGIKHLQQNPVISLVSVELHTYEGYQYKGPYLSYRDCTAQEVEFQVQYMKEFTDTLALFGYSASGFHRAYFHPPFIAIFFQANQVFDQSPKNGTGGELGKKQL